MLLLELFLVVLKTGFLKVYDISIAVFGDSVARSKSHELLHFLGYEFPSVFVVFVGVVLPVYVLGIEVVFEFGYFERIEGLRQLDHDTEDWMDVR